MKRAYSAIDASLVYANLSMPVGKQWSSPVWLVNALDQTSVVINISYRSAHSGALLQPPTIVTATAASASAGVVGRTAFTPAAGLVGSAVLVFVDVLDAGPATITVSMDGVYSADDLLHRADRNLDLVMLTSNLTDVKKRIVNDTQGPLSLDGLISQHGELFMRAKNTGERDLTLVIPHTTASSPDDYQQPIRFPIPSPTDPNTMVSGCTHAGAGGPCKGCRCPRVSLPAVDQGDWSLWQEVGSLMDTFMPGVWTIYSECPRSLCAFPPQRAKPKRRGCTDETMPGEQGTPLNQSGVSFSVQFGVRSLRRGGRQRAAELVRFVLRHPAVLQQRQGPARPFRPRLQHPGEHLQEHRHD